MSVPDAIVRDLRAWLATAGDARVRKALETLIPGAKAVGVPVPALRAKAAELRRAHRDLPVETIADIMDRLVRARVREEILVGTFWLARCGRGLAVLPWRRIAAWLDALDNWETCDQLAMGVAAPVLDAEPGQAKRLLPLTRSRSLWVRRFALATASALNQKGRAHVAETLAVCHPLAADPAPEVRKAVGWALRAATPHDAAAVERFLNAHADTAHPSVVRQGAEKLPAARREAISRRLASRAPKGRSPRSPARRPRPIRPASARPRS
jgi:3-methyladenine DNA glycosylase AlkD